MTAKLRIAVMSRLGSTKANETSAVPSASISMCSPNMGRSKRAASTSSALTSVSRRRWLAARKRKQIRGEVGATGGGFGDQPCDCGKVRPIRNRFRQDFDRSADDGED